MTKGEIKTSEQIVCWLDIIKTIFETNSKEEWNKLYEPLQVMKKQKMKVMDIDKLEKDLDNAETPTKKIK